MHKASLFRSQVAVRGFAFSCVVAMAGCTATGALTTPAQSSIQKACTDSELAVSLASFAVKTPAQLADVQKAETIIDALCSPSALAADSTPTALSNNVLAIESAISTLNSVSGAANVAGAANPVTPVQ